MSTATSLQTGQPCVAIVDIDGVVYDYVTCLGDVAAAHLGRPREDFPPAECWDFFKDQWGLTLEEYLELVDVGAEHHGLFATGDPFIGALEGWGRLVDAGVRIHIATHLGDEGDPKGHQAARRAWLHGQGLVYDEITFSKDKAAAAVPYLKSGWRVFAIDDAPPNYYELVATGAETYLLDQRWNHHLVDARRVRDFDEFASIVVADTVCAF